MTRARVVLSDAPRWLGLLGLGAVVLALHLVLLSGGFPGFTVQSATALPAEPPHAPGEVEATGSATVEAPVATPQVLVTQVRWVVQTTAAEPPPLPLARPRAAPIAHQAAAEVPSLLPAAARGESEIAMPLAIGEATAAQVEPEESLVIAQASGSRPPAAGKSLPPAQPPASARLQYAVSGKIKGFSYNAEGTLEWQLADGRYSARMEMRMPLLGSRVQTSVGRIGPEGLQPERFADKSRSERAAHFEREQQRIRFSSNAPEAELLPGAQDRLSLFFQIGGLLQARPQAYAKGQIIDMQVAGAGDAEIWRFQVGEETRLVLPAGEFRARHLLRQPRKEFDSTVEMWLAPDLNHLPVRLRIAQSNGDVADQQLSQKP